MSDPTYTREEMDAILRRALERQQAKADGIGHEELVDAAAEVGIPREEVEAAAREIEATRTEGQTREAARAQAIQRFGRGATAWGIFSVVFASLALLRHESAFLMPILFWGLALAVRAIRVFVQKDYESKRDRRRRRREERRQEFDERVQVGADALVRVLEEMRRVRDRSPEEAARVKEQNAARVRMKVDLEPMTPTRLHPDSVTPRSDPSGRVPDDEDDGTTVSREGGRARRP
jgi:hypothetical protein